MKYNLHCKCGQKLETNDGRRIRSFSSAHPQGPMHFVRAVDNDDHEVESYALINQVLAQEKKGLRNENSSRKDLASKPIRKYHFEKTRLMVAIFLEEDLIDWLESSECYEGRAIASRIAELLREKYEELKRLEVGIGIGGQS